MTAGRILLISAAFCVCAVLVLLSFKSDPLTNVEVVDQAMVALQEADRPKLVELQELLESRPGAETERQLIESGVMLVDGRVRSALADLEGLSVEPSLRNHRKLLIAVAMLRLDRKDEARKRIEEVLVEEPGNEFAKLGLQLLDDSDAPQTADERFVAQFRPAVDRFCGDCHASPLPSSFPKDRWAKEVAQGYGFYGLFDRQDLDPPDQGLVTKFYEIQAPLVLAPLHGENQEPVSESNVFRLVEGAFKDVTNPAVAHIEWGPLQESGPNVLLLSDMRSGKVMTIDPQSPDRDPNVLGELGHPCHTTKCDLDQDGGRDILVADLGSFYPEDHRKGRVVCLRSIGDGRYDPVVLLEDVGRVCDVQPGDFDGDGDLDLVVAEFGWRTSGRVLYLANQSTNSAELNFQVHVVDPRHGAIHVPVIDLDGDGNLDFIALISQEHETVVAFLGDGKGKFNAETLYSANDPSYGSSGISLADLDRDGDQDILFTNGDTFDSDLIKPYHGVQWLENQGGLQFEHHRLINCYGAYRADAQDVDLDGDLDIVVVAALPVRVVAGELHRRIGSIYCLVNDGEQNFETRVIESGNCLHTTCDFADVDGDGDPDMVVGRLNVYDEEVRMPMVDLWLNDTQSSEIAGGL